MNTLLAAFAAMSMGSPVVADDLLPDASLLAYELASAYVTTNNSELPPGTRALRFSTASVNYGLGRLEIRGGAISGGTQLVNQRVYRTDGSFWDRPAGSFIYHPSHGHIHFEDWTIFRLKQVLPNNGVGATVATGAKTSFCIIELRHHDSSAPGHNTAPSYNSCGQVQGLRPGWADVYGASLSGQFIDLTGVPDGVYWLEGDVDPDNLLLESDETNNAVRIQVAIGSVPTAVADSYEDNDSQAITDARPEGGANSPNLGLVLNERIINDLSMEDSADWYKMRIHAGSVGSYIQMDSPYLQQSNLNLSLHNSSGTQIRSSTGSYSWENISLEGLPAGDYYIRVTKSGSGNNPLYRLIISPTPNNPPFLNMELPAAGTRYVEKSYATFPVQWNGGDPDQDPKFVSILRSREAGNNGIAEPIPGYQDMPNAQGSANINTADFGLGKWFVLGVGTDGGAQTLSWAPGAVWIYIKGDINKDGHVHEDDYWMAINLISTTRGLSELDHNILDMDRDGKISRRDMLLLWELVNDHDH
ncbi:MAG: hypothetical protein KF836_13800 [Fimbriimonadaceae bacterium]|nr:hypothetical protein [Fimbriimonadaceae bacterium]